MFKNKIVQKITGYVIVVGLVVIVTSIFLIAENRAENNGQRGNNADNWKYAEYIKDNMLYHITKVLDGDTFIIDISGHEVIIRLIGIDTPEIVDPRKPVQCYGKEASVKAEEILYGKDIYLEKEIAKGNYDQYGRVLAYAILPDGTSYNKYMIKNGFAREYTFNKEKYRYQEEFKDAQKLAKKNLVGLWEKCK
ncbi:MAG TPA: thermonuclease family protein [Candidatus Paceibacterota bacterium]